MEFLHIPTNQRKKKMKLNKKKKREWFIYKTINIIIKYQFSLFPILNQVPHMPY